MVEVPQNIDEIACSIDQMRLMIDDRRLSVLCCLSLSRCLLSPSPLPRSFVLMIDDACYFSFDGNRLIYVVLIAYFEPRKCDSGAWLGPAGTSIFPGKKYTEPGTTHHSSLQTSVVLEYLAIGKAKVLPLIISTVDTGIALSISRVKRKSNFTFVDINL